MAYVLALLNALINNDGKITATLSGIEVKDGPRPRAASEFGADISVLEAINNRTPGEYQTIVRLGTGVAMTLDEDGLKALDWFDREKIEKKFGKIGPSALICPYRDLDAPGAFMVADTASGVPDTTDFMEGCLKEMVEIGLYNKNGYGQYDLITGFDLFEWQGHIKEEQMFEWNRLSPKTEKGDGIIILPSKSPDTCNGQRCILRAEPQNGSLEIVLMVAATFYGDDWKIRDTEHRPGNTNKGESEWVSLDRRFGVICQREGKAPIMFFFKGGIDIFACPIILEGENVTTALSEKSYGVLKHLGWLE